MSRPTLRRVAAMDLRLQYRHGIVAAVAVVTLVWALLLRLVDPASRTALLPLVLYCDVGVVGLIFVGGQILLERRDAVLAALGSSALPPGRYVAGKLATFTGIAAVASGALVLLTGEGPAAALLVVPPVVLLSLLCVGIAVAVAARVEDVTRYLLLVQLPLAPVMLPLLAATGWLPWGPAQLVPTAGPLRLLVNGLTGSTPDMATRLGIAYAATAAAVAMAAATRSTAYRLFPAVPVGGPGRAARGRAPTLRRRATRVGPQRRPLWHLLDSDVRTAMRDPVLVALLAGPLAMALLARLGVPPLARALAARADIDLLAHRSTMLALLLVVTPMLLGAVGGLLLIEERDDATLPALLVTPVATGMLVGRRALVATLVAGLALVVTVPLSGLADGLARIWPAVVAATAVAPLFALGMPTVSANRLESLAVMKAVTLPAMAPLLDPWLPDTARAIVRIVPTWWVVAAAGATPAHGPALAFAGVALLALMGAALHRLLVHRIRTAM